MKSKRNSEAVFKPDVYREMCPFERDEGRVAKWVWCLHCGTIYELGWYVWEESSKSQFVNGGWDNGDCVCPVDGCGGYFLDHWWLNADGSRNDTGDEFIKDRFESFDIVSPYGKAKL
jgi:hypothetical protein